MALGLLLWLVTKKRIPPYYSASKAVSSSNQVLFTMRAIPSLTFMILPSSMSWTENFTSRSWCNNVAAESVQPYYPGFQAGC